MKFKGKWNPETNEYRNTCLRLSKDLTNFKRDSYYIGFVGNDTRSKEVVEAFDKVVKLPYVSNNDLIGNPILHGGKSAATLRFMKVVQDNENANVVVEIGGGYGGQCLVYKELTQVNYTIVDLPEALHLSKAYLKANNVECNFISSEEFKPLECDLLISDYCLSELDSKGIDFYLDNITFKRGYFTLNGQFEYIKNKLISKGYTIEVSPEQPKTSKHDNEVVKCYL
jgi:hypothetical protein